jgi:hypothetical protein
MMRHLSLLSAVAALLALAGRATVAADAPVPGGPFLVARKTAGSPESEGRTVVGRGVPIVVEVFNAGSKCVACVYRALCSC